MLATDHHHLDDPHTNSVSASSHSASSIVSNNSGALTERPAIFSMLTQSETMQATTHARNLINFINRSPSPFHVVQSARQLLGSHGFRELLEHDSWKLAPNDRVFMVKNESTIIAAAIGGLYEPGNGLVLFGAHTDSPCLRLKPVSERVKEGYVQLGVEAYGGGLWYTWFDRDLTLAGRVIVRNSYGNLQQRFIHLNRPVACVPSLAIHLCQEVKTQGFMPNTEQHLVPILCTSLMEQLVTGVSSPSTMEHPCGVPSSACPTTPVERHKRRHPPVLLRLLAQELNCSEDDIVDLELCFADVQPAQLGGALQEFIHAPRLDNQLNSFAGLQSLVDSLSSLPDERNIRAVCLYDHEEVGSTSTQGANSTYTVNVMRRICNSLATSLIDPKTTVVSASHFEETLAKSFLVSADQAHAVHPCWHDRHECNHRPQLHAGMVLKYNALQRYATNSLTASVIREVARIASVPLQDYVVRQDMLCGSTIGPLLSSQLGVPTVDVGGSQLAMHSCRETTCISTVAHAVRLYTAYFQNVSEILLNLRICNSMSSNQTSN